MIDTGTYSGPNRGPHPGSDNRIDPGTQAGHHPGTRPASGIAATTGALPKTDTSDRRPMWLLVPALAILVLGLPVAVWLDLRELTREMLARQNAEAAEIVNEVRTFYSEEILARISESDGTVSFSHDFRTEHGTIPIPATFSIELGKMISGGHGFTAYAFISDYPFLGRERGPLDTFERNALAAFRSGRTDEIQQVSGGLFGRRMRFATPVMMNEGCVGCHNSHPESRKTDWRVGDVRGIQVFTSEQPLESGLFAFKYLFAYFLFAGGTSVLVLFTQHRQNRRIEETNTKLHASNVELAETQQALQTSFDLMEGDLEDARRFQHLMLPPTYPRPDRLEWATWYEPARHVGGDFFDVFELPGERIGIVIADVSDKGVKAAFFTAVTRSTLMDIAETCEEPMEVLRRTNDRLIQQNPSELFVTIIYGVIDLKTNRFSFANCGHPSPMLRHADGRVEELVCVPCLPLAVLTDLDVQPASAPFEPGDTLCLYTDGVTDSGAHRGDPFGLQGLEATIGMAEDTSATGLRDAVAATVAAHDGEAHFDDVALVVVRYRDPTDGEQPGER